MHNFRRTAMIAATTLTLIFSAPFTAQASSIYPPAGACTVDSAVSTPGGNIQLSCAASTFAPSEPVTITVTGENGSSAAIGMVRLAISTASAEASSTAAGALSATTITLPRDASGTYNIAAVSPSSVGGTATTSIGSSTSLSATGLNANGLFSLWVGGGALLLAGGIIATTVAVRRYRDRAEP